jgi:CelD/BcsL family acetyltransferase involved in cellulose biosynthesis
MVPEERHDPSVNPPRAGGRGAARARAVLAAGSATVDVRPFSDLAGAEIAAWSELSAESSEPNPWYDPVVALPAARALRVNPKLLRIRRGEELLLALPLAVTGGAVAQLARTAISWRSPWASLAVPLVRRGAESWASDVLARWARGRLLILRDVPLDGPFFHAITGSAAAVGVSAEASGAYERAVVRASEVDGTLLESRSDARAKDARRRLRALERDVGTVATVDRSDDPRAIDDFLRMEASGWKGRAGTAFVSDPRHASMLTQVSDALRANGGLQVIELVAGDRRVAMQWNLRAGAVLFGSKTTYDEEYGRFGPGILLEFGLLDLFRQGGLELLDSCTGPDNATINSIYGGTRPIGMLTLVDGITARAAYAAVRAIRATRRRVRR